MSRGVSDARARRQNLLLQGQLPVLTGSTFCADSYFSIRSTPVLPQQHVKKSRSCCQKCRSGRLRYTRMHNTYVALHEVTWCMVVWCTQNLRRDGSSFMWHQPCQCCKYTTSVDSKTRYKAIHSCRITCERNESARERRIALYKSDEQHLHVQTFICHVRGRARLPPHPKVMLTRKRFHRDQASGAASGLHSQAPRGYGSFSGQSFTQSVS